ncbi:MAG: hypothetical protein R3C03_16660 [Pirellulaceae bacterium]
MHKIPCNCGSVLKVRDEHLGRRVKCPKCQQVMRLPTLEALGLSLAAEEEIVPADDFGFSSGAPNAQMDFPGDDLFGPGGLDDFPEASTANHGAALPAANQIARPAASRRAGSGGQRKKYVVEKGAGVQSESDVNWPMVGGGIFTCIISVAILVVGLMFGWLFYFMPILFILGLVSIVKGLMGHADD